MAKNVTLIELGDVLAFSLECKHCGSRLTLPYGRENARTPHNCVVCDAYWDDSHLPSSFSGWIQQLQNLHNRLRLSLEGSAGKNVGFRLRFEIQAAKLAAEDV